jgi:hypothetical protein
VGHLTVVLTAHRDAGLCNEDELLRILRDIDPGVIFEELSSASFRCAYGDMSMNTLEVRAIRRLLKEKAILHFPVDEIGPPVGFRERMDSLLDYVETDSLEYVSAVEEAKWKAAQLGFGFFATAEFAELSALARHALAKSVTEANSDILMEALSTWNDLMQRREEAMVSTVLSEIHKNPERKAAFLVGAEHRKTIVDCLAKRSKTALVDIAWSLWAGSHKGGASIGTRNESAA